MIVTGPPGAGGVCGAVQTAPDQAGGDAGRRGQGVGEPEAAGRGCAVPVHHLPLRVADAVTQQHDRAQAHPAGLAGRGGGASQEQASRPGRAVRAACGGEEAQEDVHRGAGEAFPRGLLRRATAALGREDRRHRREARPQEECGACLVLQPAPEAEAYEVRGATLTGDRRGGPRPTLHPPLHLRTRDSNSGPPARPVQYGVHISVRCVRACMRERVDCALDTKDPQNMFPSAHSSCSIRLLTRYKN